MVGMGRVKTSSERNRHEKWPCMHEDKWVAEEVGLQGVERNEFVG